MFKDNNNSKHFITKIYNSKNLKIDTTLEA